MADDREPLDPGTQEELHAVFAAYGRTAYLCQTLEKSLATLLLIYPLTPRGYTSAEFNSEQARLAKLPIGSLVKEAEKLKPNLSTDDLAALKAANTDRVNAIHHYWWDRCSDLYTAQGRASIVAELQGGHEGLDSAIAIIQQASRQKVADCGLDPNLIDVAIQKAVSGNSE